MQLGFTHGARVARAGTLLLILSFAPLAWGDQGAGSLFVPSSTSHSPTHWDIPVGVPTVAEIHGVLSSELGGGLPNMIPVVVKSSKWGNSILSATRIGTTANYRFTYTPPAIANGSGFDACGTTIVAYGANGQNTNNDLIDDGQRNGSANSASGFRFLNTAGQTIPCEGVGVEARPWSNVKKLYAD